MSRPLAQYETQATAFCAAIREIASDPEALENLENYLSYHFGPWLERFANTPDGIAEEMQSFSGIALPF